MTKYTYFCRILFCVGDEIHKRVYCISDTTIRKKKLAFFAKLYTKSDFFNSQILEFSQYRPTLKTEFFVFYITKNLILTGCY